MSFSPDGLRLATGHADGTAYLWDVTETARRAGLPARPFGPGEPEELWAKLAGEDATKAHSAVWTLIANPEQTLPLFRQRLRPAPAADTERIRRLIADLDSPQFKERNAASRQLAALGDQAEFALQQVLEKDQLSLELRRRIERILAVTGQPATGEVVRRLRAIQVLGQLASPEARTLLRMLAEGAAGARETRAAQTMLNRLDHLTNSK
jgi:hypothetical protein